MSYAHRRNVTISILALLAAFAIIFACHTSATAQEADAPETTVEAVVVVENDETLLPETPGGDPLFLPVPLLVAAVVGMILPPIQAFFTKPTTDPTVKFISAIVLALAATFVQLWSQGHFADALRSGDWLWVALVTIVASQASFPRWRNSQALGRLETRGPDLIR